MIRTLSEFQTDALAIPGHSLRQPDLPLSLTAVNLKHDSGFSRWIIAPSFQEQEVGAHLLDRNRRPMDNETHLDRGGMCTVTLLRNHERKPACRRSPVCFSAST